MFCLGGYMSVQKIIKFYKFVPQPSFLDIGLIENHTLALLKKVLKSGESYGHQFEKANYTFDILEIGEDYVFATCAKENELKYTNFWQIRNKETNQTKPYIIEEPEKQLEVYTYFYIDCTKNKMAVIQQKSISKIHEILYNFLYTKSGNMLDIFIAPERIKDVKKAAKKLKKANRLKISFAPGKSKDNIRPLAKSLGNFEYESYVVDIKLVQSKNNNYIDSIAELSDDEKKNFNNIMLTGKNEFGLEETINFFESFYSKNIPFELTDDYALNIQYIKDKLANSFNDIE